MNKLTLSAAALTAIVAPVQVQATDADDLTQKIAELNQNIGRVINEINDYLPEVRNLYLTEAADIQTRVNQLSEKEEVTQDEIDGIAGDIILLGVKAETYNKSLKAYKELDEKMEVLETDYEKALKEAKSGKYPNVQDDFVVSYEALGVENLRKEIDGFNLHEDVIDGKKDDILGRIENAAKKVTKYSGEIKTAQDNYKSNEDSYQSVVDAVTEFDELYKKESTRAFNAMPSEVYIDWQKELIDAMNAQNLIVQKIAADNVAAYKGGEAYKKMVERLTAISDAKTLVENLVDQKQREVTTQETAKTARDSKIKTDLDDALKIKTDKLEKYGLTALCQNDIAEINEKIEKLRTKVEVAYKEHKVNVLNIDADVQTILSAIKGIKDNSQKYTYNDIIDSHEAHQRISVVINEAQEALETAMTAAAVVSKDGAYNALEHYPETVNAILNGIKSNKNTEDNKSKVYASHKNGNESKITAAVNSLKTQAEDFKAKAEAALAKYNAVKAAINDAQTKLDAVRAAAKEDLKVTVDGTVGGKSYQDAITETQTSIDAKRGELTTANAVYDTNTDGKDNYEELDKIKTDNIANVGSLDTWAKKYSENKTNFGVESTIVAAGNMLAEADRRIKALKPLINGVEIDDTDTTDKKKELEKTKQDLKNQLGDDDATGLTKTVAEKKTAFEGSENKAEDAPKIIAEFANINNQLQEIEEKAQQLVKDAESLAANHKAYDETIALTAVGSDVDKAIKGLKTKMDATYPDGESDSAYKFYKGKYDVIAGELATIKTNIGNSYTGQTAVKDKGDHQTAIGNIVTKANNLKGELEPNKNKHNDQLSDLASLNETWQAVYTGINNGDLSSKKEENLQTLSDLLTKIQAVKKPIEDAYAQGQSVEKHKGISGQISGIRNEIKDLTDSLKKDYATLIADDNSNAHKKFANNDNQTGAYYNVYATFGDAIDKLNQFSDIKNDGLTAAIANLLEYHEKIYVYAEKLRKLKSDEQGDYDKYLVNPENKVYDVQPWLDKVYDYDSKIKALLKEYQDKVNPTAKATFEETLETVNIAIKNYESKLSNEKFKYGEKDAFKDIKNLVKTAESAGITINGGGTADPMYAVHIDEWMESLKHYETILKNNLAAAFTAEKDGWYTAVERTYQSETAAIKKLENIDGSYLTNLDKKYAETYTAAKNLDNKIDAATDGGKSLIRQIVALCKGYYKDATYKESQVFADAKTASSDNTINIDAYNAIQMMLGAADAKVKAVADLINKMYVAHDNAYDVYVAEKLQKVTDELAKMRDEAEVQKEAKTCGSYKTTVTNYTKVNGTLDADIKLLKNNAVHYSINSSLEKRIDAVKEQYNQVAKKSLEAVEGYASIIEDYRTELNGTDAKSISSRWTNGDLKGKADNACNVLIGFEKRVVGTFTELFDLNKSLNGVGDEALVEEVTNSLTKADAKLDKIKDWSGHNNYTEKVGTPVVNSLENMLATINAYKSAHEGDLLFYKDNILSDINNFMEEADARSKDLKKEYDKQKAYDSTEEKLDGLTNDLTAAYNRVTSEEIENDYAPSTWKVDVERQIADIQAYVNADRADDNKTVSDASSYNDNIIQIAKDIDEQEALYKSTKIGNDIILLAANLETAHNAIKAGRYSPTTGSELDEKYVSIKDDIKYATKYNNEALTGNITHDVNGNELPASRDISYNLEAYQTLKSQIETLNTDISNLREAAEDKAYILGNVDDDKVVTVNDYNKVIIMILNNVKKDDNNSKYTEGQRYGADANNDGEISVGDLSAISNILFSEDFAKAPSKARTRVAEAENSDISLTNEGEETTIFGKTVRMAINLSHSEAFTTGQLDITMPQGMKIVGQSMSDRANGHDIFANDLGNGVTRLLTATIDNNEFNGRNGALIYLDVEVGSDFSGGQISIDNIIFSDAAGRMYSMSSIGGNGDGATGIDGIKAATVKERIYSIGGQMMKTVKKGINIIVGEDGKSTKVIKK